MTKNMYQEIITRFDMLPNDEKLKIIQDCFGIPDISDIHIYMNKSEDGHRFITAEVRSYIFNREA